MVGVRARDCRRATVRIDVLQSAARGRIGRSKRSCSLSGGVMGVVIQVASYCIWVVVSAS